MATSLPSLNLSQYANQPPTQGVGLLTPPQRISGEGSAKLPFSSSLDGISDGSPRLVLDSGTSPGFIEAHTFSYGVIEEVYLWCCNPSGVNAYLTMSFESTSSPAFTATTNLIVQITAQSGMYLVYPGIIHQGNATGTSALFLRASAASSLNVSGFVVRSYPFPEKDPATYGFYNADAGD